MSNLVYNYKEPQVKPIRSINLMQISELHVSVSKTDRPVQTIKLITCDATIHITLDGAEDLIKAINDIKKYGEAT